MGQARTTGEKPLKRLGESFGFGDTGLKPGANKIRRNENKYFG